MHIYDNHDRKRWTRLSERHKRGKKHHFPLCISIRRFTGSNMALYERQFRTKLRVQKGAVNVLRVIKSVSMRKPGRTRQEVMQLESPIFLKLGINVGFGE